MAATLSIIIPVYNGATFLAEAVASLTGQDPPPGEIVVVDDGSTDAIQEVVKGLGTTVRYIRQANGGPAAARNHGLRLAVGDIIGFLDVDDLWQPGSLAGQLALLEGDAAAGIVKGLTQVQERLPGNTYGPVGKPFVFWNLGGTLYRREVFTVVGPFDEGLRYAEDLDWFLRARDAGIDLRLLDQVTQLHRRHGGNMTEGRTPGELNILRVVKASLDRRRAGGPPSTK